MLYYYDRRRLTDGRTIRMKFSLILQRITKRWTCTYHVAGLAPSPKFECKSFWIYQFVRRPMRDCSNMIIAGSSDQTVSIHFVCIKIPILLLFLCSQFFNTHISKINQLFQKLFVTLLGPLRRSPFITIIGFCIILLFIAIY
jgi:hypothetical protein